MSFGLSCPADEHTTQTERSTASIIVLLIMRLPLQLLHRESQAGNRKTTLGFTFPARSNVPLTISVLYVHFGVVQRKANPACGSPDAGRSTRSTRAFALIRRVDTPSASGGKNTSTQISAFGGGCELAYTNIPVRLMSRVKPFPC